MRNIFYNLFSLVMLSLLNIAGVIAALDLTHPFWHKNAILYGAIAGAVIAGFALWLAKKKPAMSTFIITIIAIIFVGGFIITRYFAGVFINSADFEPMAIQIWHIGSYTTIISFVPLVALILKQLLTKG